MVDRQPNLDNLPASLHPHYQASSLLPGSPPLSLASVLCPLPFHQLGVLPWTRRHALLRD